MRGCHPSETTSRSRSLEVSRAASWLLVVGLLASCERGSHPPPSSANVAATARGPDADDAAGLASALRERVQRRLAGLIDADHGTIVVGITVRGQHRIFSLRDRALASAATRDDEIPFMLGSLTKVFAGVALAHEIDAGRVSLDAAARTYLPDYPLPEHPGGEITVRHLATFTSGLPWMPSNWEDVPAGRYGRREWRAFLSTYALPSPPGSTYVYGNVGFGILGDLLEARAGVPFFTLLQQHVLTPLQMTRTWWLGEPPPGAWLPPGRLEDGAPHQQAPTESEPVQRACCALVSTAGDLLRFLDAHVAGLDRGAPLQRDLARAAEEQRSSTDSAADALGLGWFIRRPEGYLWKSGRMSGTSTAMFVDRTLGAGFLVLSADNRLPVEHVLHGAAHDARVLAAARAPTLLARLPEDVAGAGVDFDEGVRLLGWQAPVAAERGSRVPIRLFWVATRPIAHDWQVLVHGEHEGRRIRANHFATLPTSLWPLHTIIEDAFELDVPRDFDGARLSLWFGMHNWTHRLAVRGGSEADANRVRGPEIALN